VPQTCSPSVAGAFSYRIL